MCLFMMRFEKIGWKLRSSYFKNGSKSLLSDTLNFDRGQNSNSAPNIFSSLTSTTFVPCFVKISWKLYEKYDFKKGAQFWFQTPKFWQGPKYIIPLTTFFSSWLVLYLCNVAWKSVENCTSSDFKKGGFGTPLILQAKIQNSAPNIFFLQTSTTFVPHFVKIAWKL